MTYELQRLVTLATFGTPWEAQITQARLAAENIPSWIADEHLMRLVALSNAVGGVQLKVRESDAEAAGQMLRRLGPLPELRLVPEPLEALAPMAPMAPVEELPVARTEGEAALRCPSCGSEDLQAERSSRLLTALLPRSRAALRCGDCGVLWRQDALPMKVFSVSRSISRPQFTIHSTSPAPGISTPEFLRTTMFRTIVSSESFPKLLATGVAGSAAC